MGLHLSWSPVIAHFARVQDHAGLVKVMVLSKSLFALAMPALYSSVFDPSQSISGSNPWSLWLPQKRRQLVLLLLHSSGFIHRVKGQFRLANNHETNESLKDVVLFADYWSSVKWIPSDAWQWLEWQAVDATIKAGSSSPSEVNLALDFTLHHARALDSITIHLGPEDDVSERCHNGQSGFTIEDLVPVAELFSVLTSIHFKLVGQISEPSTPLITSTQCFSLNDLFCYKEQQPCQTARIPSLLSASARDKLKQQKLLTELDEAIADLKKRIQKREDKVKWREEKQESDTKNLGWHEREKLKLAQPRPLLAPPKLPAMASVNIEEQAEIEEQETEPDQDVEYRYLIFEKMLRLFEEKLTIATQERLSQQQEPEEQQHQQLEPHRIQEAYPKQQREQVVPPSTPPPPPPPPNYTEHSPQGQIKRYRRQLHRLEYLHQEMAKETARESKKHSDIDSEKLDLSVADFDAWSMFSRTQQVAAVDFISRHQLAYPSQLSQVLGHPSWPFTKAITESAYSPSKMVIDLTALYTPAPANADSVMGELVDMLKEKCQDLEELELINQGFINGKARIFGWAVERRLRVQKLQINKETNQGLNSEQTSMTMNEGDDDYKGETGPWVYVNIMRVDEIDKSEAQSTECNDVSNKNLPLIRKLALNVSNASIVVDGLNAFKDTLVHFEARNGLALGHTAWNWTMPRLETLNLCIKQPGQVEKGFSLDCIRILCPRLQSLSLFGELFESGYPRLHLSRGWQPPAGLRVLRLENHVYDEMDFCLQDLESLKEIYWSTAGRFGPQRSRTPRRQFGTVERYNREYNRNTERSLEGFVSWRVPDTTLLAKHFDHLVDLTLVGGAFEDWRFGFFAVAPNLTRFSAADQFPVNGKYHSVQRSDLKYLVQEGLKDSCQLEILDLLNVSFDLQASRLLLGVLAGIENLEGAETSFSKLWAFSFDCSTINESTEELEQILFMIMKRPEMKLVMLDKVDKRFVKRWLKPVDPLVVPVPVTFPDSLVGSCFRHLKYCVLVSKQTSNAYCLQDAFLNM